MQQGCLARHLSLLYTRLLFDASREASGRLLARPVLILSLHCHGHARLPPRGWMARTAWCLGRVLQVGPGGELDMRRACMYAYCVHANVGEHRVVMMGESLHAAYGFTSSTLVKDGSQGVEGSTLCCAEVAEGGVYAVPHAAMCARLVHHTSSVFPNALNRGVLSGGMQCRVEGVQCTMCGTAPSLGMGGPDGRALTLQRRHSVFLVQGAFFFAVYL